MARSARSNGDCVGQAAGHGVRASVRSGLEAFVQLLKRVNRFRLWLWETPAFYELRGRSFQLKERLRGYPALHRDFQRRTGYPLQLSNPQTFHHKVTCLKIRRPPRLFVRAVDKSTAKDLAMEWAADLGLQLSAARTLAVVDDPKHIPWDRLPQRFVIKATHRSGANRFIDQGQSFDREELLETCRSWLGYPYGVYKHEWAYWAVPRRLLIEELIEPEAGAELLDYKFHMSRGKCLMIQVNSGLRTGERRRSILFPPWSPQPVTWLYPKPDQPPQKPVNLAEMMALAEAFSREFPYLRVDLYSLTRGSLSRVLFGEFTFFPGSGSEPVDPYAFDLHLGQRLTI